MLTVLLYVVVMVVVGAALFAAASAVFGRGEALAPIPPGTTATVLPATDVTGVDVHNLRFQQVVRGYKTSEVDWALDRLAREIDGLRARVAEYERAGVPVPSDSGERYFEAGEFEAGEFEDFEPTDTDTDVDADTDEGAAEEFAHQGDADAETEAIATDAVAARAEAARVEAARTETGEAETGEAEGSEAERGEKP